jgi:hypothetical protein
MDEKILTLHPQGKKGVRISKDKYDVMRATITAILKGKRLTHVELTAAVEAALKRRFTGSIPWYTESVKLDLEARKVIERVEGKPHDVYRLR